MPAAPMNCPRRAGDNAQAPASAEAFGLAVRSPNQLGAPVVNLLLSPTIPDLSEASRARSDRLGPIWSSQPTTTLRWWGQ